MKKTFKGWIQPNGDLLKMTSRSKYIKIFWRKGSPKASMRGNFSLKELKAISDYIGS